MLPVIIWTPLEEHSDRINNECPKCKPDGISSKLSPVGWTDDQSYHQPRLLYGIDSNVLLVSRIYCCANHHYVLAHHPDILQQYSRLNISCLIPFHLWHRAGFTASFMTYVDHLLEIGIAIQQVESMCASNRIRLFYSLKEKFEKLQITQPSCQQHSFPMYEDESMACWRYSPTCHAVAACFLYMFRERETLYHYHMSSISLPADNLWLSCDHTFKSVSNIGITRPDDKHWIKQFNGLFCVLNSDGQVMSWRMTKRLSFQYIRDNLVAVQQRFQRSGQQLQEFYVDTCCSLHSKLKSIFGPQLKVFLDIFHAVQRISSKISKRHPYHAPTVCILIEACIL